MKALVVCHKTKSDIGILEDVLNERGISLESYLGYQDALTDIDPKEHDLLIYMGGPMGVYQSHLFPYLETEIDFLKKRIDADKPYLGICLGAQLLAAALGSKVYPGEQGKEVGWHDIKVNEDGMKTPIHHLDYSKTKMMQWHGDTFDKPEGITLLASSDLYVHQAFNHGKNILGLQCHPEVKMDNLEMWMSMGSIELEKDFMGVINLRKESLGNIDTLNKQTRLFFNEWLDEVL